MQTCRMLPEWAEIEAVMLAWPHQSTDWQPWLPQIQQDYVELAVAISSEAVPLILCQDQQHRELIRQLLGDRCQRQPVFAVLPYNDTWCRDYGPLCREADGQLELLDFRFQGWGDKYDASLDNQISGRLSEFWSAPLHSLGFELEGGSIETDGQGSLLSTRHCLLESGRNPDFGQADIEQLLREQLGADRILWISAGALLGDDTDSHIDNLVRFCDARTLAYAACSRREDVHFEPLQAMEQQVLALTRADGKPYHCVPVEIPEAQFAENGSRLPGSYVNFLILNNAVLVPVFGCAEDARALNSMQQCFPGKRIVPVPGGNLIRQFGGPHCATMQLPAGVLKTGWCADSQS